MLTTKQDAAAEKLTQLFAPEFSIFIDLEDWYEGGDDSFHTAYGLAKKVAKVMGVEENSTSFDQIIDRSYTAIEELI